jgi:signal peptidase I
MLCVASFVVFGFVLQPIRVRGISMEPTYRDGQVRLVNRTAYWFGKPRRGDVVAIRIVGHRVLLMKRVIGLPGERLAIHAGTVRIDGRALSEPYARRSPTWFEPELELGSDEYYLIGDNRSMRRQRDHEYGRAPFTRIAGKVLF